MKIGDDETEIRGDWEIVDGELVDDANTQRINALRNGYLSELGRDETGWEILYMDPNDGRLWELTYPQSEMHGGGPPLLTVLSSDEARRKYSALFH